MKTAEELRWRIEWIDTLKGIGIFLVFLGHLPMRDAGITKYIFSFHMPLFFFISGMFFMLSDVDKGFYKYFLKKLRTRMVPYFSFGMLTYFIWSLQMLSQKYGLYQGSQAVPENLLRPLMGMFYGNGFNEWLIHNTLLWFLACLMITEFLFFFAMTVARKNGIGVASILFLFSIVGYVDSKCFSVRLPLSIDIAFTAVVFYGSGYIIKSKLSNHKSVPILCGASLGIGAFIGLLNETIDMNLNQYGNIFLFYCSSFASIYAFICISKYIQRFRFINYIAYVGKNSIVFFLMQNLAFLAVNCLIFIALHFKVSSIKLNFLYGIAYVVLSIAILFPISYFISRYCPFITGKGIVYGTRMKI